ncbi:hypothetical protein AVEN_245022-1 [Araneus ventricosus]|uniref:Uncharacterized protein n=1 Tax=Araneus ventricosus TaxID=182803 RepID=A0A4Y2TRK0_ARAVE|nr:hypothetical protein AVEN_4924-1 [Araneus ventricosus]GBO03159.1 hypothetical protein AVEN_245022-1 [Araneus ventricosus]
MHNLKWSYSRPAVASRVQTEEGNGLDAEVGVLTANTGHDHRPAPPETGTYRRLSGSNSTHHYYTHKGSKNPLSYHYTHKGSENPLLYPETSHPHTRGAFRWGIVSKTLRYQRKAPYGILSSKLLYWNIGFSAENDR